MNLLQIEEWDLNFENDRSRTRDNCRFVCVPNKQHGMGFSYIMAEPDGAAIYGIWGMILGACSQQSLPRHGWLTGSGESAGSPWGAKHLAVKFRRPIAEVERALQVLTSPEIGWIKIVKHDETLAKDLNSPPSHRPVTADSPPSHPERKGKEGKGNGIEYCRKPIPVMEEVMLQSAKIGLSESEAEKFYNYYSSNGWRVGKNPMKSWTHALTNWKNNSKNYADNSKPNSQRIDRSIGTANEGKAMLYKGLGRLVPDGNALRPGD